MVDEPTRSAVRAVLLDLDDTLVPWQSVPHWQWAWRPRGPVLSERHTRAALKRALHRWDRRRWETVTGKSPPVDEASYRGFLSWVLTELAGHPLAEAEATAVVHRFLRPMGDPEWFPDAAPLLKLLAERSIPVGTIAELPSDTAKMALRRASLPESLWLEPAPGVERLPKADAYRAACARLGAKPREVLYVGDLFWSDVRAAARAGCVAVLIDRWKSASRVVGPRITTLAEVPALVEHPPGAVPEPETGPSDAGPE